MNTAAVITASIFLLFPVCAYLSSCLSEKSVFAKASIRTSTGHAAAFMYPVALLVFIFTLIMKGLPVAFVIISNVTILFVFIFTVGLIYFMTRSIVEAARKAEAKMKSRTEKKTDKKKAGGLSKGSLIVLVIILAYLGLMAVELGCHECLHDQLHKA